jgi:NADPH-dependent glutamate synthase beta subunit-like oxidoreductase
VFLAPGCRKGRSLRIPGADAPGVLAAVDFLLHVNLGRPLEIGHRVLVVGGGNVAFDAARSARRFGGTSAPDEEHHNLAMDATTLAARALGREVTLMSLEARHELPADQREWEEGLLEGVGLLHRRSPRRSCGTPRAEHAACTPSTSRASSTSKGASRRRPCPAPSARSRATP